jgi:hypothetical protein
VGPGSQQSPCDGHTSLHASLFHGTTLRRLHVGVRNLVGGALTIAEACIGQQMAALIEISNLASSVSANAGQHWSASDAGCGRGYLWQTSWECIATAHIQHHVVVEQ